MPTRIAPCPFTAIVLPFPSQIPQPRNGFIMSRLCMSAQIRSKRSAARRSSASARSEATGCEIYGKAEFMNPGGSVKDRAALFIVKDAEERGLLRPGGVIVEGTAGNTGIGLALVANARGYRTVIVIPETQSQEKKDALRQFGADLREVPAAPYANPNNYVKVSGASRRGDRKDRAGRRDLGEPVRQRSEPARAPGNDRSRDLGADRRQGRRLHLRRGHRRNAGGRRHVSQGAATRCRHRDRGPDGRRAL